MLKEIRGRRVLMRILDLIDGEFRKFRNGGTQEAEAGHERPDGYTGWCAVCGHAGRFVRDASIASIRENYRCRARACKASLRYREQARLVVKYFAREGSGHMADLVKEEEFRTLKIYEPGMIGPFRRILGRLPCYHTSFLWMGVPKGEYRHGVECQDLTDLTYDDDYFDLVITSDIFEHVRRPFEGFREVDRVLKPGGFHIFSIPVKIPMSAETVMRVDTSGDEDVFVLPAHYHGAPFGGKSLVYTDFGADMARHMACDGIDLRMEGMEGGESMHHPLVEPERILTFYWKKQR